MLDRSEDDATPPTAATQLRGGREMLPFLKATLRARFTRLERRAIAHGLALQPRDLRMRNLQLVWAFLMRGSMNPRRMSRVLGKSGHLVSVDISSEEEEEDDDDDDVPRAPLADAGNAMASTAEELSARSRSPGTRPRVCAAPLAARDRSRAPPSRPVPPMPLTPKDRPQALRMKPVRKAAVEVTKAPAEKRAPAQVPSRAAHLVARDAVLAPPLAKPRALTTTRLAIPSPTPSKKGQIVVKAMVPKSRPSVNAPRA
jgi:hypothetical protein